MASAGASAALAGLLFVAVSINVERILALDGVPERAMQALIQLMVVVVVSLLALAPGQSAAALGIEVGALGLFALAVGLVLTRAASGPGASKLGARLLLSLAGTLPFVIGGVSLIAESGGGLYWVLAGVIMGTAGAVTNAWVLLVEILR